MTARLNGREWVYGLTDPRDGLVWYVGRSRQPARRLALHRSTIKGEDQKARWLRELRAIGLLPEMVLLKECKAGTHAAKMERAFIRKERIKNPRLTNHDPARAGEKVKLSVLSAIKRCHERSHPFPPRLEDVRLELGLSSRSAVTYHLPRLEAAGWVELGPNRRGLALTARGVKALKRTSATP